MNTESPVDVSQHSTAQPVRTPARFDHLDADRLQNAAHRLYRDIYANETH